jgi:hypothetical protein
LEYLLIRGDSTPKSTRAFKYINSKLFHSEQTHFFENERVFDKVFR